MRDGDRDTRRFRASGVESAAALDWLSLISSPEKLIPKVFGELAKYAVGAVADRAKKGALGWLTSIAERIGLIQAEPDELGEIQSALEAMGKQLTRLEGQVEGLYQAQLAVLLNNYWTSKPDAYSQATIQQNLAQLQNNVMVNQRASLKPSLPGTSWIDPSTGLMWTYSDSPVDGVTLRNQYLTNKSLAPLAPFRDWRLATSDELARHTSVMKGGARTYFNAQLGFEDAVVGNTWTSDSLTTFEKSDKPPWRPYIEYLGVTIFNLNSNANVKFSDPGQQYIYTVPPDAWPTHDLNSANGQAWLRAKVARGVFYVRRPGPQQDYPWGAARPG